MPTRNALTADDIYQLKITLLGTKPPIWRRVLVPGSLTLAQFHEVLQLTMGWDDCHLHEFRIGGQRFGVPDPMDTFMGGPGSISEKKVRLYEVIGQVRAKAEYHYDFGDDWVHRIVTEKVLAAVPGDAYPVCTGGAQSGPPEDCGGIYGYYNLLEAINDPENERHEELLESIDDGFAPDYFSIDDINKKLAPAQRRWRNGSRPA